ncbi:MAG: formylglycine-generating enzyme family protein [Bacteroidales bacterium]|nr:formylglycine-generating enzyme family protein [Bacteroidales bacterium]
MEIINNIISFMVIYSSAVISFPGITYNCNTEQSKLPEIRELAINNKCPLSLITIIPKGKIATYVMGITDAELKGQATMEHEDYYTDDEQPAHLVSLSVPFEMSQYEITNEQFCEVMNWSVKKGYTKINNGDLTGIDGRKYLGISNLDGGNASYLAIQFGIQIQGDTIYPQKGCKQHPVHAVTWYGAISFCNFLSEMSGLPKVYSSNGEYWDTTKNGFRLPTEAEWEYAARKDKKYNYAWGDEINIHYLNYGPSQDSIAKKSVFRPVGFFNGKVKERFVTKDNSSPFGIYDMNGNVWEWCWDWYGRDYYKYSTDKDPKGPKSGDDRPPYDINVPTKVWRGCGWVANDAFCRITKRWSANPDIAINELGFRIVISIN